MTSEHQSILGNFRGRKISFAGPSTRNRTISQDSKKKPIEANLRPYGDITAPIKKNKMLGLGLKDKHDNESLRNPKQNNPIKPFEFCSQKKLKFSNDADTGMIKLFDKGLRAKQPQKSQFSLQKPKNLNKNKRQQKMHEKQPNMSDINIKPRLKLMDSEDEDTNSELSLDFKSEVSFNDVLEPLNKNIEKEHQEILIQQDREYLSLMAILLKKLPEDKFNRIHTFLQQLFYNDKNLSKEQKQKILNDRFPQLYDTHLQILNLFKRGQEQIMPAQRIESFQSKATINLQREIEVQPEQLPQGSSNNTQECTPDIEENAVISEASQIMHPQDSEEAKQLENDSQPSQNQRRGHFTFLISQILSDHVAYQMKNGRMKKSEGFDHIHTLQDLLQNHLEPTCLDPEIEKQFMNKWQINRAKAFQSLQLKDWEDIVLAGDAKKAKRNEILEDSFRGSKYRGVSKNGTSNWQVLTMIDKFKLYVGTVNSIQLAAVLYDILQIQVKGLGAKSNFAYTKHEFMAILLLPKSVIKDQQLQKCKRAMTKFTSKRPAPENDYPEKHFEIQTITESAD